MPYNSIIEVFDKRRMTTDDKARRLLDHLQTIMETAESAVAGNPTLCETLSSQEMRVLGTVGRHEHCVMSMIARRIRLSLSGVTSLVDRMVEKRLVRRDRSEEDRRVVQVELTPQGRELHEAAVDSQVRAARGMLQALSAAEQEELLALFGKIAERIKAGKERS